VAGITVAQLLKDKGEELKLVVEAGEKGTKRKIRVIELNRPGITLAGCFDFFRYERIQIIGKGEYTYLKSLSEKERKKILERLFELPLPCLILTSGFKPFPEMVEVAEKWEVPLLVTELETAPFASELGVYLEEKLAPLIISRGVLMEVYGLGVLIVGESGIGKSECALELLKRGHFFVADDVVEIRLLPGKLLEGTSPVTIRNYMEVRGLGIIDVRSLFGVSSLLDKARIGLVVRLVEWEKVTDYDRLGMEEKFCEILGIKVPEVVFPVKPGRNLAILVEVAAINQRLKNKGYIAVRELDKHLIQLMGGGVPKEKE
jgi:HPr kinase/phosphorylase